MKMKKSKIAAWVLAFGLVIPSHMAFASGTGEETCTGEGTATGSGRGGGILHSERNPKGLPVEESSGGDSYEHF